MLKSVTAMHKPDVCELSRHSFKMYCSSGLIDQAQLTAVTQPFTLTYRDSEVTSSLETDGEKRKLQMSHWWNEVKQTQTHVYLSKKEEEWTDREFRYCDIQSTAQQSYEECDLLGLGCSNKKSSEYTPIQNFTSHNHSVEM